MFEHFNERARQVVVLAQDEARTFQHDHIGREHILLGLVRFDHDLAARLLDSPDLRIEDLRGQILDRLARGEESSPDQLPFSARAKKVLELAFRESLSLGHRHVGPEHVLLGLLREEESVAARELEALGATVDEARERVARLAQYDVSAAAPGVRRSTTRIPFAPGPERVLAAAQDEARSLRHDYMEPSTSCSRCCETRTGSRRVCSLRSGLRSRTSTSRSPASPGSPMCDPAGFR